MMLIKSFSIKFILILILALIGFSVANAQNLKLSEDPNQFIVDVNTMMTNSKNAKAMKAAADLQAAWGSLNDKHKKLIIGTSILMIKKKCKTNTHFTPYLSTVANAVIRKSIPASKLDTLLFVTNYLLEDPKPKKIISFLETTKLFMESDLLYKSNFNKLRVVGGSYSFGFVKSDDEGEEGELIPEIPVEEPEIPDVPIPDVPVSEDSLQVQAPVKETPPKPIAKDDFFRDWDAPAEEVNQDWGMQQTDSNGNVLEQTFFPEEQPKITGAYIRLAGVDLQMVSKFDSTVIMGTKGSMMFSNKLFVGDGGKFDWSVAEMPETFIELSKYHFHVISAKFSAEDVKMNSPNYVEKPIKGVFEFKSTKHKRKKDIEYPRFMSYNSDVVIKNIGENIKYKGGFSLNGDKVYSSSLDENPAIIEVYEDNNLKFKSSAKLFVLGEALITSDLVSIAIYQKDDSITHQGVSFHYDKPTHMLKLIKDKYGYRHTPYIDSYHGLEITCDMLSWNLQSKKMDFDMITAKNQNPAMFESGEFFQHDIFDKLKGLYPFHPLIMVVAYAKEKDTDIFNVDNMIMDYKVQAGATKGAMKELVKKGFIAYNNNSGEVKIKEKAWHYFNSNKGKKDYDEIEVKSLSPSGTNASLDLDNNILTVRGVDKLYLSKHLNVFVLPKTREVSILQKRDMVFTGQVFSGHFLFQGRDFRFDYDSFFVEMQNLDSLKLLIDTKDLDEKGNTKVAQLSSQIESTSGTLFINKQNNKSGKKEMPEYPMFKSNQGSSVYYNSPHTLGGVYEKRIFFEVPPFMVDSLNSNVANGIAFHGTMHSDGIFPDFPEILTVMPDMSLGYVRKTPKGGFPLYKGKGKYVGEITLNNSGLRGHGTINYLSTTLKSEDFVYFPDSVYSVGTSCVIKEGKHNDIYYPDLEIDQNDMKWHVYKDTMIVANFKNQFDLYGKTVQLDGRVMILLDGLWGDGTVSTRGSHTTSQLVRFQEQQYNASEAFFTVESNDPAKPALRSANVKLHFDFKAKHAYFSPEIEGYPSNEFPFLKYKTSMNDGDWDLDKQMITFKMPENGNLKKSYFRSYATDQDSLYFNAKNAVYDIKALTLSINGVPEIRVTDAKIFPDKETVAIKASTKLQPLVNAKIAMDTTTYFHKLHTGNIRITSRSEFLGDAIYDYVNAANDTMKIKMQPFKFEEFDGKKDKEKHTTTRSIIRPQDTFLLAPRIFYKGDIKLKADEKHLTLDGFVKLKLKGFKTSEEWLKYDYFLNKDSIEIKIDKLMFDEQTPLTSGICITDGHYKLYPTFLSRKRHSIDLQLFEATGSKLRIKNNNEFTIGTDEKLDGTSLEGNVLTYNDSINTLNYQGKINIFDYMYYGTDFIVNAATTGAANLDSNKFIFNTTMSLTLNAPPKAMALMATQLADQASFNQSNTAISDTNRYFISNLANIVGNKEAGKYEKQIKVDYKPIYKVAKSIADNFVITDVKLIWSNDLQAWHSEGDIGIANINKKDVNYRIKGYIEIKKFAKGDKFHVFLEPAPDHWYYMVFEFNRLSLSSSDQEFQDLVAAKSKGKTDNGKYCFVVADPQEKLIFIKNFTRHYIHNEVQETPGNAPAQDTPQESTPTTPNKTTPVTPAK